MSDIDNSDPPIQLFAKHRKAYPRKVEGIYRRRKWFILAFCLALYYLVPFLRYDRGPSLPDQAVLIDMVNRRAYFLFIEIWPQEVYFLTGILVLAAISLFFATSLFGRVWCGYLCFQTVWTDLFVWVERIIQGDRAARMKLDASPLSFGKVWRKLTTHLAWIGISLLTAGTFVLYFNDAPTLVRQMITGEGVSHNVLAFVFGLTASTYIMAGWAREQVCTFMCPYARFQSAMFDDDTLIIAYDAKRGEPRGKHKQGESWEGKGHCVDCTACVQVCPTGIDIRNGLQIECIACGLCVDACDGVMEKVGLPKGLIRYDTSRNMKVEPVHAAISHAPKVRLVRPRTVYYSLILLTVALVLLYGLLSRSETGLNVLHDRNPLFVQLSSGEIRNGYDIHVLNKSWETQRYTLSFSGLEGATMDVRGTGNVELTELEVPADSVGHFRAYIRAPKQAEEKSGIVFSLTPLTSGEKAEHRSIFISKGAR